MNKNTKKTLKQCAASFFIFGVACIVTSIVLGCDSGKPQKYQLPPEGGLIGPITYNQDNTIIQIDVNQNIAYDRDWAFITGELLDQNQKYLFGFGDEFWKESGYDSEGAWSERVTSFDTKVTIPKKGTYYFRISNEKSQRVTTPIIVTISQKIASGLAFMVAGVLSMIVAVVVNIASKV